MKCIENSWHLRKVSKCFEIKCECGCNHQKIYLLLLLKKTFDTPSTSVRWVAFNFFAFRLRFATAFCDCVPPCLGRVSGWWVGADFNGLPINFFRIKFFFWPSHFDQLGLMLLLLSFHEFWSIFKDFASIFVLLPLLPPLDWTQSGLSLCCWETAVAYCSAQPGRRYALQ